MGKGEASEPGPLWQDHLRALPQRCAQAEAHHPLDHLGEAEGERLPGAQGREGAYLQEPDQACADAQLADHLHARHQHLNRTATVVVATRFYRRCKSCRSRLWCSLGTVESKITHGSK